jgi:hypothetical protein
MTLEIQEGQQGCDGVLRQGVGQFEKLAGASQILLPLTQSRMRAQCVRYAAVGRSPEKVFGLSDVSGCQLKLRERDE